VGGKGVARTTERQMNDRVNEVAEMIVRGANYRVISDYAFKEWECNARSTDTIVKRAKVVIAEKYKDYISHALEIQLDACRRVREYAFSENKYGLVLQAIQMEFTIVRYILDSQGTQAPTESVAIKGYMTVSPDDWDSETQRAP